jgi:hypothetical protein
VPVEVLPRRRLLVRALVVRAPRLVRALLVVALRRLVLALRRAVGAWRAEEVFRVVAGVRPDALLVVAMLGLPVNFVVSLISIISNTCL